MNKEKHEKLDEFKLSFLDFLEKWAHVGSPPEVFGVLLMVIADGVFSCSPTIEQGKDLINYCVDQGLKDSIETRKENA